MSFALDWMPEHAPYMPVAVAGLLALLEEGGGDATACWMDGPCGRAVLEIVTDLDLDATGELIAAAAWPREEAIEWPSPDGTRGGAQALKPLLKATGDPLSAYRRMVASAPPLEAALLRAIVTDAALDADGVPLRSRLLRGVKGDLASVFKRPKGITGERLAAELRDGPDFRPGESGLGLGLVPEVQTFGGTTGPDASTVGAYSALLYLLLWRGLIALPPLPVVRGLRHTVGGPLVTAPDVISWPRWRFRIPLRGLRILFMHAAIHADVPDHRFLQARGVDAVYRARTKELNSMIAVYRWGEQLAA